MFIRLATEGKNVPDGVLPWSESDDAWRVEDLDGNGQTGFELLVDDEQRVVLAVPAEQNKVAWDWWSSLWPQTSKIVVQGKAWVDVINRFPQN